MRVFKCPPTLVNCLFPDQHSGQTLSNLARCDSNHAAPSGSLATSGTDPLVFWSAPYSRAYKDPPSRISASLFD